MKPDSRIIVIDGGEKVGKSTLTAELIKRLGARSRHWGPIPANIDLEPGDVAYGQALREDLDAGGIVVWDRSWASEHVYAQLLLRIERRLYKEPLMGEWLYGRAVQACGLRIMLMESSIDEIEQRRDDTDLPVDPRIESLQFYRYARSYGWHVLNSQGRTPDQLATEVERLLARVRVADPVDYCGPVGARVVVVGERPSTGPGIVGGWLPFTTRTTTALGMSLGPMGLDCGWTNASLTPAGEPDRAPLRRWFDNARLVVACGHYAEAAVIGWRLDCEVRSITHPSALYRWGAYRPKIQETETRFRNSVQDALES